MTTHEHTIDIDAPVTAAYRRWEDVESFPQFMDGVEQVTRTGPSQTHWKVKIAGVEREFDATFTNVPDERISWRADGVEHAGDVAFVPTGAGTCRVQVRMDMDPDGLAETVGEALGFIDRKIEGDLARFKDLVEGAPPAAAGAPVTADPLRSTAPLFPQPGI